MGGAIPLLQPSALIVWEGETTFFLVQRELPQPGTIMACAQKTKDSYLSGDTILTELFFPAFPQLLHSNACTVYQIQLSLQFIIR